MRDKLTCVIRGLLVGAIVALVGCGGELPPPSSAQAARRECPPESNADYFFPADSLSVDQQRDEFNRRGPTLLLTTAAEPSLSCGTAPVEAYRFIWIHAFSQPHPTIVRATKTGSVWSTSAIQFEILGERIEPMTRIERELSKQQSAELVGGIENVEFWAMPGPATDPQGATDGAIWIIEGRRGAAYHVVRRWGLREGSLYDAALTLVKLAGLPVPPLMSDP